MNEPDSANTITQLIQEFQDEYRELSEDWRAIDQKADGAMRFAATLLAATAAVVFRSNWNTQHFVANLLLIPGVLFCVASSVAALMAARVRSPSPPPRGTQSAPVAGLLAADSTFSTEAFTVYRKQQLHRWKTMNRELRAINDGKAGFLQFAQWTAIVGVILVVLTVAAHIYIPAATGSTGLAAGHSGAPASSKNMN